MAITCRNTSTYSTVSGSTNTIVPIPSGTSNGDIIIAISCLAISTGGRYMTGETMTRLGDNNRTLVNPEQYYSAFYRVWHTGDPTGITFLAYAGGAKVKITMASYYGDYNSSSPIDAFSNTSYYGLTDILRAASINVTAINSPIIFFGGVYSTTSKTFTKSTSLDNTWVEDYDNGDTTCDMWHNFESTTWSSSGATNAVDATISAPLSNKHAFMLALNVPSPSPPTRRRLLLITHL
jgi:hypothetical protein